MGYGKTDVNEVQNDTSKFLFHKVPDEGGRYFFCPPWSVNQKKPYHEIKVHFGLEKFSVLCLSSVGKVCPVCMANNELRADTNSLQAQALSKEIYGKSQFLYNFIMPVDVAPGAGGQKGTISYVGKDVPKVGVYMMGPNIKKIVDSFYQFYQDIHDPTDGNMLLFSRQPSKDPKYPSKIFVTIHPLKSQLEPKLLALMNNLHDLTTYTPVPTEERLKALVDAKLAGYRASRSAPVAVVVPSIPQVINPIPVTPDLTQNASIASSFVQSGVAPVSAMPSVAVLPNAMNSLKEFEASIRAQEAAKLQK